MFSKLFTSEVAKNAASLPPPPRRLVAVGAKVYEVQSEKHVVAMPYNSAYGQTYINDEGKPVVLWEVLGVPVKEVATLRTPEEAEAYAAMYNEARR